MMNIFEVISLVLNLLFVGGGIVTFVTLRSTRRKAEGEAKRTEIDNDEKASEVMMTYIVKPLKTEINALRRDVRNLQKAIDKISDCPHADTCPVRHELQNPKADSDNAE